MSATPRPWRVHDRYDDEVWAGGGWVAACVPNPDKRSDENETGAANADLIVRAVNAHDALVAALRGIITLNHTPETYESAISAACAALKLAESDR